MTMDPERTSYAKAASHGFGLGQREARRYVEGLTPPDFASLRAAITDDVGLSRAVAQSQSVPFDEYVRELVDKGQVEPHDGLDVVYRAGFDTAFSAYLVESLATDMALTTTQDEGPSMGVSTEAPLVA